MIEESEIKKIKDFVEEFFLKMTITTASIEAVAFSNEKDFLLSREEIGDIKYTVKVDIQLGDPQILIGQGGQTLFEMQRLLRTILNKKLQKVFYLDLDINNYKKQKVEYLKDLARDLASQVALLKQEKRLPPMGAYERRAIHAELSQRTDITTESQGEGPDRHIVIKPK